MPSDDELKAMTRDLDFYQREVVNKVVKFARDIVKQGFQQCNKDFKAILGTF